jgi:TolA-binding protein
MWYDKPMPTPIPPSPPPSRSTSERFTQWIGSTSSVVAHTIFFLISFVLGFFGINWNTILLVLTTVVSLEAIYLAIFIQMTVNRNTESLAEVEEDIDEMQEDLAEVEGDIDEIQEDIGEIHEEEKDDDAKEKEIMMNLQKIQLGLQKLMDDFEHLKRDRK